MDGPVGEAFLKALRPLHAFGKSSVVERALGRRPGMMG
jgi:hypothetical protein